MSDSLSPRTTACQAPQSMEFSRQEYWSGLPFPFPGDLLDLGIKLGSPALQANSLPSKSPGKTLPVSRSFLMSWLFLSGGWSIRTSVSTTVLPMNIQCWFPSLTCWASLVAQALKNLPAMQETQVRSLGWEDPLEKGMATYSSIFVRRVPMNRVAWQAIVHGIAKSWTQLWLTLRMR